MNNQNVEKLQPTGIFTNYIFKAIPLAFDESMSYYETLCGLLDYLKNTIIPTVNNNADVIIEYEEKFIELKEFVDNYFDNLDVQEEINNKLDEMVEDGTMDALLNTNLTGSLSDLNTTDNSNLVSAINEVNGKTSDNATNIGNLSNLDTTDKTNLVGAINEVNDNTYSNHIVKLTGTISNISQGGSDVTLSYPNGYNINNSIIISGRVKEKFGDEYGDWHSTNFVYTDISTGDITYRDLISIENNGISYVYDNLTSTTLDEITVEIYLMKI